MLLLRILTRLVLKNEVRRVFVPRLLAVSLLTSASVSIRQHPSAYVSIRQHTSAYVSIRQHTSAYVSIRQRTSAYVSICHRVAAGLVQLLQRLLRQYLYCCTSKASKSSTFAPSASRRKLRSSSGVSICTFVPVKQVNRVPSSR